MRFLYKGKRIKEHNACSFFYSNIKKNNNMTKKKMKESGQPRRRFHEATDGPVIRRWYSRMRTADLARKMGLTVRQITNYVYRWNWKPWARKLASVLSKENRENGKRGGRPKKKS